MVAVRQDRARRGRTPAAPDVFMDRWLGVEDRVYHLPGGLDRVFAGEQALIAPAGIADQALVRWPLDAGLVAGEELDRLAGHRLARSLGPGSERDRHIGRQPEAQEVAVGRLDLREDHLWWLTKLDERLGCGDRQGLARPDVDRHAAPAPGVEVEPEGDERLHRGVG